MFRILQYVIQGKVGLHDRITENAKFVLSATLPYEKIQECSPVELKSCLERIDPSKFLCRGLTLLIQEVSQLEPCLTNNYSQCKCKSVSVWRTHPRVQSTIACLFSPQHQISSVPIQFTTTETETQVTSLIWVWPQIPQKSSAKNGNYGESMTGKTHIHWITPSDTVSWDKGYVWPPVCHSKTDITIILMLIMVCMQRLCVSH